MGPFPHSHQRGHVAGRLSPEPTRYARRASAPRTDCRGLAHAVPAHSAHDDSRSIAFSHSISHFISFPLADYHGNSRRADAHSHLAADTQLFTSSGLDSVHCAAGRYAL